MNQSSEDNFQVVLPKSERKKSKTIGSGGGGQARSRVAGGNAIAPSSNIKAGSKLATKKAEIPAGRSSTTATNSSSAFTSYSTMAYGHVDIVVFFCPRAPDRIDVGHLKRPRSSSISSVESKDDLVQSAIETAATFTKIPAENLAANILLKDNVPLSLQDTAESVSHIQMVEKEGVVSGCLECRALQARMDAHHTGALLRQAALNVEYEVKKAAVPYLPAAVRERVEFYPGKINTGVLHVITIEDMVSLIPAGGFAPFLASLNEVSLESLKQLLNTTRRARQSFVEAAHPTTSIDGVPITYDGLVDAVSALGINDSERDEDVRMLSWLRDHLPAHAPFLSRN